MHKKAEPNERVHYVDFTSLYPFCQTQTYFYGHPNVMTTFNDNDWHSLVNSSFGFIKCLVLPPQDLLFPVLPCKVRDKLIFGLCFTCSQENAPVCVHSPRERAISGVWASVELQLAIAKGYQVLEVYEVWDYPDKGDELFLKDTKLDQNDYVTLLLYEYHFI